jgi:hypothetical protein
MAWSSLAALGLAVTVMPAADEPPVYAAPMDEVEIFNTPRDGWRNVMTWCSRGVRYAISSDSGGGNYRRVGADIAMILDPGCKR